MDEDATAMDEGCCKDQNLVIKNAPDFTFKHNGHFDFAKMFCNLFYISAPFFETKFKADNDLNILFNDTPPPPRLQNKLIISTSVLRI